MKIEIAEPGRMTQSGSSLLKLIQNNKTPVLDLLVRESIQNSLDAHTADAKSVTVEYLTGTFSSSKLGNELEGISAALSRRFPADKCHYLAVCDSNTVGLTGEMDVQKVKGNDYGNLLKLVYEICKPQEKEGAGGSWGLGKTIYFRIGIGLVIYYSRIDEGNGQFSSRLAASYVENETSPDAMIPEYKGLTKRGIAWWGETIRENTTVPVTDDKYINQFLSIFGVSPYVGNKTGTMIIIPYINTSTLLANNRIDYADTLDEHLSPYWFSSVENYLRVAVQRWYAPRLANPHYPYGAYLKVLINGNGISADSMEPIFQAVQTLYNRANHVVSDDDFLSVNQAKVEVKEATVKKFLHDTIAGNIACTKLNRDSLQMVVPHNKPEPAVYFNCEITDKSANRPLVFFVRQPGMIVSYENVSAWTAGIPSTNTTEYILGIFVLNSFNRFKVNESPVDKLEEYVRKSEMADHTSWNDWTDDQFNPRIITKLQKSVTKVISSQYADEDVTHQPKKNSELSRYLGDLILPPDGFGNGANSGQAKPPHEPKKNQKKFSFSIIPSGIRYHSDTMTVPMELKTSSNKKIKRTGFEIQIASEAGKIGLTEWENDLKLTAPFFLQEVSIFIDSIDGEKVGGLFSVNQSTPSASFQDFEFVFRCTPTNSAIGLYITSAEEHSVRIKLNAIVHLRQKNVRPAFVFDKEVK